ncbi:MAG: hypothetical protein BWY66_00197 [bacterium ADurb.Bin374]|nr:MAG: hypothetical protein BWY66_00197 [bacterium ADurb.Bin374]
MNEKNYPTLVAAAENISWAELLMAPELSTLAALDASLLATTTALRASYPILSDNHSQHTRRSIRIDEHLAESICILAQALRRNLTAYYVSIQESCEGDVFPSDIEF